MPQQILIIRPPLNQHSQQCSIQMPNIVRMIEQAKPPSIERVLDRSCWPEQDKQVLSAIDLKLSTTVIFLISPPPQRLDDYLEAFKNFINAAQNIGYIMVSDPEASQAEKNEITFFCGTLQKHWEGTPVKVLNVNFAQPTLTEEQKKSLIAVCEGKLSEKDRENKIGKPKRDDTRQTNFCPLF